MRQTDNDTLRSDFLKNSEHVLKLLESLKDLGIKIQLQYPQKSSISSSSFSVDFRKNTSR